MLSIISLIICLSVLGILSFGMIKVDKLIKENNTYTKINYEIKSDFSNTLIDIKHLKNENIKIRQNYKIVEDKYIETKELYEQSVEHTKQLTSTLNKLHKRVECLEDDNRRIKNILENYNMMAENATVDKSFKMKLIK